jgi:competence protein ComEC
MNTLKAMNPHRLSFFYKSCLSYGMPATKAHLWNYAPFLRLLIPLMAGIILQWYVPFSLIFLLIITLVCVIFISVYFFLPEGRKFQFASVNGIAVNILLASIGACLVWIHDIRHNQNWIGYKNNSHDIVVRLLEPPVEKQNSFKVLADIHYVNGNGNYQNAQGKIIIYFKKDFSIQQLHYGSQIVFNKPLQLIKNSGNPGSFNYQQHCLFQGITHQVYLTGKDFQTLSADRKDLLPDFLFRTREQVISILKKYINGEKEQGLAEALLIGYKDDLDKNLVQSYSNTGVVHIIAISGLHLGLIYWLLLRLTRPLKRKKLLWLRCVIIISFLWLFSLLAGGAPSVLRSAVMFTCLALGEASNRKGSIYNTLALSAFVLLAWNPFWLWDVGFQLSYSAVLSIIIFFRPVYNWVYCQNKAIDWLWKLIAVSLAAQVLTFPITVYHFHQFPVLFLLANFIAVPLSSAILIGEILLVVISFFQPAAKMLGWLSEKMIWMMNLYVERLDRVSFAVWNNLSISIPQAILLLGFIAAASYWLMEKEQKAIWPALICLLGFFTLRSISFVKANNQKELIVYNVPKHTAIDVIDGRQFSFIGDDELQQDDFIRNFHLQPSRILHRIKPGLPLAGKEYFLGNQHIVLIDSAITFEKLGTKAQADILILSGNPKLYISNLTEVIETKQIVIDSSVPHWKAELWKKDCDSLHLPHHDVSEKGAFVMKLQ